MTEYIYFELNDRKLKINKENSEDIWIWRESKNPFWLQLKLKRERYIRVNIKRNKLFLLHRVVFYAHNQDWDIFENPLYNIIDHIDRDKHNNNITNLRLGTAKNNQENRSNVKGYYKIKNGKFVAQITVNGKGKHIGSFVKEEDARQAYLKAKELYHEW